VTRRLTRVETPGYGVARAVSAATCLFGSGLRYIILVRAADHRGLHAERVIFLPLGVIAVRRRADASRNPRSKPYSPSQSPASRTSPRVGVPNAAAAKAAVWDGARRLEVVRGA
jgi:hypothetical protein